MKSRYGNYENDSRRPSDSAFATTHYSSGIVFVSLISARARASPDVETP